ncbi:MAG: SRPBCC domain-containing protein, partial [Caulobacteraceae bacterium]
LRFGWRQAAFAPGHDTEVEVSFEAVDDGTRITVQHVGWDSVPADHIARHGFPPAVFLRRHAEWWRDLLDGLRNRIDQGST